MISSSLFDPAESSDTAAAAAATLSAVTIYEQCDQRARKVTVYDVLNVRFRWSRTTVDGITTSNTIAKGVAEPLYRIIRAQLGNFRARM